MPKAKKLPHVKLTEDRLLVLPLQAAAQTAGGIVLPEPAREKPTKGHVLAVGCGRRKPDGGLIPCDVKVGDLVAFTPYQYSEVEIAEQVYYVVRESDVLYVEEGE